MFLDAKPPTIVVVGDIMLDYTTIGSSYKMANEAPIPVFLKESEKITLGGCGNVLQNLHSLGCKNLFLFSMCGDDMYAPVLKNLLRQLDVEATLISVPERKTTTKHRFFSNNKLLFRYDNEEIYTLPTEQEEIIITLFKELIERESIDCVLFSDYNKGFLTDSLCRTFIRFANERQIFTCVDPKNNYLKYKGCSLIKPNRNEVGTLFDIHYTLDHLESAHKQIQELVCCKNTVITLGELGISGYLEPSTYFYWKYSSNDVIDVTGAGDVVNAVLAYFFPTMKDKESCLQLASYLGTVSVSHIGVYTLCYDDILKGYKYISKSKFISRSHLKKLKKPIVFTNGCFDILHEGHVSLLRYCKTLANDTYDVVLALNSDASIQRLKGSSRPIYNLSSRIAVLNSIEYIDWIVVFEEDTPETLLKELQPSILVKGGDYTIDTVLGKEYCKEVKIFRNIHEISTTQIVNSIRQNKQS